VVEKEKLGLTDKDIINLATKNVTMSNKTEEERMDFPAKFPSSGRALTLNLSWGRFYKTALGPKKLRINFHPKATCDVNLSEFL
jgi:hypothetical protein